MAAELNAPRPDGARLFETDRMEILIYGERSDGLQIREFAVSHPGASGVKRIGVREPYYLHLILSGSCEFYGKELHAGDVFLTARGLPHSYAHGDGFSLLWFGVTGPSAAGLLASFGIAGNEHESFRLSHPEYASESLRRAYAFCRERLTDSAAEAKGALLTLLSLLDRHTASDRKTDPMEQAAAFFRENYYHRLNMNAVARQFYLSEKHFCRRFRERFGVPPQQYLLTYRMDRAAALLLSGDLPVKEIAVSVGYESPLSFSRAFRKSRGRSPAEYRRLGGEADPRMNDHHD